MQSASDPRVASACSCVAQYDAAHAPAAADSNGVADTNPADVASSAPGKCVGAATEVTVVIRGRVGVVHVIVDVVIVDVDGVDGASVVVVAAVTVATAAGVPPVGRRRRPQGCVVSTACPSLPRAFPP